MSNCRTKNIGTNKKCTYLTNSIYLGPSGEAASCAAIKKNFQNFMVPESSLPCSQEPSTGPYPEPDHSSPYNPSLSNITHPPKHVKDEKLKTESRWMVVKNLIYSY
jgi:hypothetical protein